MTISMEVDGAFGRTKETIELCPEQFPVTIGRFSEATVKVSDQWLSRLHCQLEIDGDRLLLRDLESANGTFVDGERIQFHRLRPGDEFEAGTCTFRFQFDVSELSDFKRVDDSSGVFA